MRQRITFLLALLTALSPLLPAQAADVSLYGLVRTQKSDTVYVVSSDGKRYSFPSNPIYHTWYADFSRVKFVSDQELANIPFGGVMFVRPGTVMVKIPSDPKVYAVASGGVLRPVKDEKTAIAIFGEDWNKQILDLDVSFFAQYVLGSEVKDTDDYVPAYELYLAGEAENVLARPTSPGATPLPSVTPYSLPDAISIDDGFYAQVSAQGAVPIRNIALASKGQVFARCDRMNECGGIAGPFRAAESDTVESYVCDVNGTCIRSTLGVVNIIVAAPVSGITANVRAESPIMAAGNPIRLTATGSSVKDALSIVSVVQQDGPRWDCMNKDVCTAATVPILEPGYFTFTSFACNLSRRCVFSSPVTVTVR
jgi:hypothetical protein